MGSSRFTNAPFFIRESDVLAHVSGARSAENDLAFISRAVRHTPLTAMLSPVCISVGACFASTVMWRLSSRGSARPPPPTSLFVPVHIGDAGEPSAVRLEKRDLLTDSEILSEPIQLNRAHVSRVADASESFAVSERHRSGPCENLGRVIQKYFVHNARCQRSPVHHCAALDQHAGNRHFAKATCNRSQIGPSLRAADRNLLHANTVLLKLQLSFFLCERAKHKHIVVGRLYDAGVERQSQTGVQDHAQERTPASAPAAIRK